MFIFLNFIFSIFFNTAPGNFGVIQHVYAAGFYIFKV